MLKVSRTSLLSKLEIAARIAPSRTPKDILRWARLDFDGTTLTITATDHEVGVRIKMDGVEGDRGTFLLPLNTQPANAVNVLKSFQTDPIEIRPEANGTWIVGVKEKFRLPALDAAEFPEWKHDEQARVILPGKAFRDAVRRVAWSADTETTRYAFGGVNLRITKSGVVCEATNSRTLAQEKFAAASDAEWDGVLQLKGAAVAADHLGGDVTATLGPSSAELSDDAMTIYIRKVEGRFPELNRCIPDAFDAEFELTSGVLSRVIRQVMLATDKESAGTDIDLQNGVLRFQSEAADAGTADIEIPVPCSESCKTRLDASFLKSMSDVLDSMDVVKWGMNAEKAHLFSLNNWRAVVMPLTRDDAA